MSIISLCNQVELVILIPILLYQLEVNLYWKIDYRTLDLDDANGPRTQLFTN
jgi:hypothetical protein